MADYTVAIDPSINFPGFAVFSGDKLVDHGVMKTWTGRTKPSDQARLRKILCDVGELCYRFSPQTVVVEDYQFRASDIAERNKDQIKKMIWSIGVVIVAVPSQFDLVCFKPHEWKGRKSKEQTIFEAKVVYGLKGKLDNNAADAIMLGHHFLKGAGDLEQVQRRGAAGPGRGNKQSLAGGVRKLRRRLPSVPRRGKGNRDTQGS